MSSSIPGLDARSLCGSRDVAAALTDEFDAEQDSATTAFDLGKQLPSSR